MKSPHVSCVQRGFSMLEVLVTIVILAIGLLGLAALQARLQLSEMEAYQRAQALILLDDMANRIAVNRNDAAGYAAAAPAGTPLGTGIADCAASPPVPAADINVPGRATTQADVREWCDALKGSAETTGGSNVGAMLGGRGCVQNIGGGNYLITVAWQGLTPISAPPSSVCGLTGGAAGGASLYNGGSACINDLCRRVVTTIVSVPSL